MIVKKKIRKFKPSPHSKIILKDCGKIFLNNDELVSFCSKNNNNSNYEITKKNWGFYATPSINKRLKNNNFETFIVVNKFKDFFIMIVYKNKKKLFLDNLKKNQLKKVPWPKTLK